MHHRVAIALLIGVLLLIMGAGYLLWISEDLAIIIQDQDNGTLLASLPSKVGDTVVFEWIHSYEHIPWIEEYTVTEDHTFRLTTIRVAGYGAGIPNYKGDTTVEDSMIVMYNIDEIFPSFAWIHSQTALVSITVEGKVLIKGTDLPHHKAVTMYLKGMKRLWKKSH
ncbi:MAG: DUF1850 domain-containing protein [Sphaerochaeta sp.]